MANSHWLSCDEINLWWNLSKDESFLVMNVMIVKEVMTGDVLPVAMFSIYVFPKGRLQKNKRD